MKYSISSKYNMEIVTIKTQKNEWIVDNEVLWINSQRIVGLVPVELEQKGQYYSLNYNMTGFIPISKYIKRAMYRNEFMTLLDSIVNLFKPLEDNGLSWRKLLLEDKAVYINPVSKKCQFIYVPLGDYDNNKELNRYLKHLFDAIHFDKTEELSYVDRFKQIIDNPDISWNDLTAYVNWLRQLDLMKFKQNPQQPSSNNYVQSSNSYAQSSSNNYVQQTANSYVQQPQYSVQQETAASAEMNGNSNVGEASGAMPVTGQLKFNNAAVQPAAVGISGAAESSASAGLSGVTVSSAAVGLSGAAETSASVGLSGNVGASASAAAVSSGPAAFPHIEPNAAERRDKFCPKCGTKNFFEAKFCKKCGNPFKPVSEKPFVQSQPQEMQSPALQGIQSPEPGINQPETQPKEPQIQPQAYIQPDYAQVRQSVAAPPMFSYEDEPEENTTVLGQPDWGDEEATTVLGVVKPKIIYPYLIRESTQERVDVDKDIFIIGKGKASDYIVVGNNAVSRNHITVITRDGHYYISDNHSTNHTYINDEQIESDKEYEITSGDKIVLGNEEFKIFWE